MYQIWDPLTQRTTLYGLGIPIERETNDYIMNDEDVEIIIAKIVKKGVIHKKVFFNLCHLDKNANITAAQKLLKI